MRGQQQAGPPGAEGAEGKTRAAVAARAAGAAGREAAAGAAAHDPDKGHIVIDYSGRWRAGARD